jgi:hypothetical protein
MKEIEFELPRGYEDGQGRVHRQGAMRPATAIDEIEPLQDPRVQANDAYLVILLLSRVVTRLGDLNAITPHIIEGLYAADLAYLQEVYQRLNAPENLIVGAVCPNCSTQFQLQVAPLG